VKSIWLITVVFGAVYLYDTRGRRHRNRWIAFAAALPIIPP
jgi:hypothetical protein